METTIQEVTTCTYGGGYCLEPAVGSVPCFSEDGRNIENRPACEKHYGYWGLHVGYDYRRPIRPESGTDGITIIECNDCGKEFYEFSSVLFQGGNLGYTIAAHECPGRAA
jgi:hypothetical protein